MVAGTASSEGTMSSTVLQDYHTKAYSSGVDLSSDEQLASALAALAA